MNLINGLSLETQVKIQELTAKTPSWRKKSKKKSEFSNSSRDSGELDTKLFKKKVLKI